MNGKSIYIGLSGVERVQDLIEDLYWYLKLDNPKLKRNMIRLLDGERELEGGMGGSRIIITDETVCNVGYIEEVKKGGSGPLFELGGGRPERKTLIMAFSIND